MKNLFLAVLLLPLFVNGQIAGGVGITYHKEYNLAPVAEIGYYFHNNLYTGLDTKIFPIDNKDKPIAFDGIIAYKLAFLQPYITFGSYYTGHQQYIDGEGYKSFTYGWGIDFILNVNFKLSIGMIHFNTIRKDPNLDVRPVIPDGKYLSQYITLTYGIFNHVTN